MANIGESLPTPESGYKRIDCKELYDSLNTIKTGDWIVDTNTSFYNNTVTYTKDSTAKLVFYVKTSKFRLISRKDLDRSTDGKIIIDGVENILNMHNNGGSPYMELDFDQSFSSLYHKIEFVAGTDSYNIKFIIDAIDIDDDGELMSEADYILEVTRHANFPVRVAGDSVTSERGVANYAKTLTNGEQQLLLLKTGEMYLTNGNGGYIVMSSGNSGSSVTIDDVNISTSKVFSNAKTTELIDGLLDKDTYASAENHGAVKYADNLSTTMHTSPLQYYGTNNANEVGMHYFPINIEKTNTGIEQKVVLDAKANTDIVIDSALDISDNKIIVDSYKFVGGQQNIQTNKVFNNTEMTNFFYDKENVEFTDSMHIKKLYEYAVTVNSDNRYESEIINKDEFLEIIGMELK